jgi:hypothetical protein
LKDIAADLGIFNRPWNADFERIAGRCGFYFVREIALS